MQLHEYHSDRDHSIVFIHGANCGGWMWDSVVKALPDFHCLVVDLPGHADSYSVPWTNIPIIASDIIEIIKTRAKGAKASVVGLSLGGYLILEMLNQDDSVLHNVMISGVNSQPIPNQWMMKIMTHLLSPLIRSEWLLRKNAKSLNISEADIETYVREGKKVSIQAFKALSAQAIKFLPTEKALQTPCRKLFVAGSREHSLIVSSLKDFQQRAVNSVSYQVTDKKHAWVSEDPLLFADTVRQWMHREKLPDLLESVL